MAVIFPKGETDTWQSGRRHRFEIGGHDAWIAEPQNPLPGNPWFWHFEYVDAFPDRVGTRALVDLGFYAAYVDVHETLGNDEGIARLTTMYDTLLKCGLPGSGALIGISVGGLFCYRFAAEHPESAACIYTDSPVCAFYRTMNNSTFFRNAYHCADDDEFEAYPGQPVRMVEAIAQNHIPILQLTSGQDSSVPPSMHGDIFAERCRKYGGNIETINRKLYGHHPHGLDNPAPILNFILRNSFNRNSDE